MDFITYDGGNKNIFMKINQFYHLTDNLFYLEGLVGQLVKLLHNSVVLNFLMNCEVLKIGELMAFHLKILFIFNKSNARIISEKFQPYP